MIIETVFQSLTLSTEEIQRTIKKLHTLIPFEVSSTITELDEFQEQKLEIQEQMQQLELLKVDLSEGVHFNSKAVCEHLDIIIDLMIVIDPLVANRISNLRLQWDDADPHAWYIKGRILFQLYTQREVDDLEGIISIFTKVINLAKKTENQKELAFWSYSFLGNLYMYRILTGEEALQNAMKNYNLAYRYAKTNEIDVKDEFIFENIETMQKILMNQYPLLIVIYNHSGFKIYEYLFQFIEVINEDQRFIPNFTALLSAVDDRIKQLFRSSISSSYMIIENRILLLVTLYDENKEDWIKAAMVFSYLRQDSSDISIDENVVAKVKSFKKQIMEEKVLRDYILNFDGRYDEDVYALMEQKIHDVFS